MKTYGLLGKNISYSLSPCMHNAAFKALGIYASYKIFDTDEKGLESFFFSLKKGDIAGCNVTIPYKERALSFVGSNSSAVKTIGALNTIVREDGALKGHNTDYLGFMMALKGKRSGDLNFDPDGKNVFMFGAGGAAKAIAYVLSNVLGAKRIIIADVDTEKADGLASYIGENAARDITIAVAHDKEQYNDFIANSDLLVNATPCGLKDGDPELFDYRYVEQKHYVFDLIYSVKTPLMKRAEYQAANAIDGLNMLLYQAARAFEYWTGCEAPIDIMREALLEKMQK
ncbi:MAG: shikimate dehydrogenase [Candidatus Omnitrophota bacterium]